MYKTVNIHHGGGYWLLWHKGFKLSQDIWKFYQPDVYSLQTANQSWVFLCAWCLYWGCNT